MIDWPGTLQINAFAGEDVASRASLDDGERWAARGQGDRPARSLAPARPADLADWRDPRVGWGLILPDAPQLGGAALAAGHDAPAPIQALLAARPDAPVLRYRAEVDTTHLRRYDGGRHDVPIVGAPRGVGRGELPRYLLIYGPPDVIPWRVQFLLNQTAAVGRLALVGSALERYVTCLIDSWSTSAADVGAAVVWAVDHGQADITHLMRTAIAEPLFARYGRDDDLRDRSLRMSDPAPAVGPTSRALCDALAARRPGVVVTTSHGMTGPLDDPAALRATLGLPVDAEHRPLDVDRLLGGWDPDGAVWYAHACCSAGSDAETAFAGVVDPGSDVARILTGVARDAGARIAPLPQALLGASKPARAFVGHVEPTFDWTIRDPMAGQTLTTSLVEALHERLFQPWPLGHALAPCYAHVGELFGARNDAYDKVNRGTGTLAVAGLLQLAALDRRSMVIIGDPTVALASPPPAAATAAAAAAGASSAAAASAPCHRSAAPRRPASAAPPGNR